MFETFDMVYLGFFLRTNKFVTADVAGLIAAGIDPTLVNYDLSQAIETGFEPSAFAKIVRDALLNNLACGLFDPEPVSITYRTTSPSAEKVIKGKPDIMTALMDLGTPCEATFNANSLWPWIIKNTDYLKDIGPVLYDFLIENFPPDNNAKIDNAGLALPSGVKSNEHETPLAEQVVALTERLQQVEKELATHKATAPIFRHVTSNLQLVAQVQERYWGDNLDVNDPDTFTRKEDVTEWLMKTNTSCRDSKHLAKMITTMARPDGLPLATKRRPFPMAGKTSSK
jgi:hypothetical protein